MFVKGPGGDAAGALVLRFGDNKCLAQASSFNKIVGA
jgi:hypothetical protein